MEIDLPFVLRPCPTGNTPTGFTNATLDDHFASNTTDWIGFHNLSAPCWMPSSKPGAYRQFMNNLNIFVTPVIIATGMTGNLVSFLVFAATHLNRQSSSIYLASLALADMGFLMSLLIIWLSWVEVPLLHHSVICESVVYLGYVCTFLSVWYVVSFTIERYIIVWYPLRKDRLCTPKRAKTVVLGLAVIATLLYSFAPWTSGVVQGTPLLVDVKFCMPLPKYYHFFMVTTSVDFTLTLVFPSVIVIVLNIRIIMKIMSVHKHRIITQTEYKVRRGDTGDGSRRIGGEHQYSLVESAEHPSGRIIRVKFKQVTQNSTNKNGRTVGDIQSHSHHHHHCNNNCSISSSPASSTHNVNHRCTSSPPPPHFSAHIAPISPCASSHENKEAVWVSGSREEVAPLAPAAQARDTVTPSNLTHPVQYKQPFSDSEVQLRCHTHVHMRTASQHKTARMLIVLSTVFVILNLPSHVFRIHAFFKKSLEDEFEGVGSLHAQHIHWQEIFQIAYHLSFSINFFIYSFYGRQFRSGLRVLCTRFRYRLNRLRLFCRLPHSRSG